MTDKSGGAADNCNQFYNLFNEKRTSRENKGNYLLLKNSFTSVLTKRKKKKLKYSLAILVEIKWKLFKTSIVSDNKKRKKTTTTN